MTRADARDFLDLAAKIHLQPRVTAYRLDQANEALAALKNDQVDGALVIIP
jgi:propanol-preferring alcohol dehydrogenase